jgi:Flp pilus assembly protein TadD
VRPLPRLLSLTLIFSFIFVFMQVASALQTDDVWSVPSFSATPEALTRAALAVKPDKDTEATFLLREEKHLFDPDGKEVEIYHQIYRIETEEGVKGWSEVSGAWQPWYQSKPEIQARVITTDGVVHLLDQKTLTDVPVHQNTPDSYGDSRRLAGPLPAVAVGAIIEEEVTIRGTNSFFRGLAAERSKLDRNVPVAMTRIVLSYPTSLPVRYKLHLAPDAKIKKSSAGVVETLVIEHGRFEARTQSLKNIPYDVAVGPEFEFSTGSTWQAVASGYAKLANDKARLADVQPMVLKATTKAANREEAVRKLVAALHANVRYTGIEFGESSWIPQFPAETLKRKYGDCKDKANLLVAMLRAAGIQASLALLDSGPGEDVNPELPGMGNFDHAIVYVPASEKAPELWIDATANYTKVGDLPDMDYGRWALVIDQKTTELKKIPELTAAQNFHREIREFTLAEYGPAKIVERDEQLGPTEAEYREYYDGDAKALREASEKYVKRAYLADALGSLEHSPSLDLEKPFWVTFTAKGKRGSTDYDNAVAAIRIEDLFGALPNYFVSDQKDDSGADADDEDDEAIKPDKQKPRAVDWRIRPYIHEWDYKIVAPSGYKVRALPPAREDMLGTARLTQSYSAENDGQVVKAVLRFDSGKSRLTVAEAKILHDAINKAVKAEPILIFFDVAGHTLIAEGKIREGLASYQELVSASPKSGFRRVQLARALLSVGLGEKARAVAREATTVDPGSYQAYSTLGWVLEHDLIGRRFKKGFDYDGALAAYRKAKELAPKNKDVRTSLAILLESDAAGERYTTKAHLKEAVTEFMELKKIDENYFHNYEDNILFDLWYLRDFKGVADTAAGLAPTDQRQSLILASLAATQGANEAVKKSLEFTTDETARAKALVNAGWLLARVYRYPEAADLFTEGAKGQYTGGPSSSFVAGLRKAKPREKFTIDESQPSSAILRLFRDLFQSTVDYSQVKKEFSSNALREGPVHDSPAKEAADFQKGMYTLHQQIEKTGIPIQVIGDVVLGNTKITVEGSEATGYRLTTNSLGAAPQKSFVVREQGVYKLLVGGGSTQLPEGIGWQALEALGENDLKSARQWLDWAREEIHINAGDDPLEGQPFPYFWNKGQEADIDAIKTASLVLAPSKSLKNDDVAALLQLREKFKTDELKARLDVVLASAYQAQEKWPELAAVAERLLRQFPDSNTALRFASNAYSNGKRLDDWDKLVQSRLAKRPDDADNLLFAARLAGEKGDYAKARELMKKLIDRGTATAIDLNLYAWDALFMPGPIGPDSVEAAERANEMTKNAEFSILHTVACIYARSGKGAQANTVLLKAMEVANMEEPDSAVWLAYGEIAEDFGENDAAAAMYARVESQKINLPGSNYVLAKARLSALNKQKTSDSGIGTR